MKSTEQAAKMIERMRSYAFGAQNVVELFKTKFQILAPQPEEVEALPKFEEAQQHLPDLTTLAKSLGQLLDIMSDYQADLIQEIVKTSKFAETAGKRQ